MVHRGVQEWIECGGLWRGRICKGYSSVPAAVVCVPRGGRLHAAGLGAMRREGCSRQNIHHPYHTLCMLVAVEEKDSRHFPGDAHHWHLQGAGHSAGPGAVFTNVWSVATTGHCLGGQGCWHRLSFCSRPFTPPEPAQEVGMCCLSMVLPGG